LIPVAADLFPTAQRRDLDEESDSDLDRTGDTAGGQDGDGGSLDGERKLKNSLKLRVRNPNLGSDTMSELCNLHYQGAKGHIYSTYTGHKYAGNPLTDGENTIYNIHLTKKTI
jgi:hypothetical protein